jgi:hypothetical protein
MTKEEKIQAEFEAFFKQETEKAKEQMSKSLNVNAVQKLKIAVDKTKKYIIEDVTPEGYGN